MPRILFIIAFLLPTLVLASPDEIAGCESGTPDIKAHEYCSQFYMPGVDKKEKVLDASHKECLEFYGFALRAENLLCSFAKDALVFQQEAQKVAQADGVGEANRSERAVAQISQEAKAQLGQYAQLFEEKAGKVDFRLKRLKQASFNLDQNGLSQESAESRCQKMNTEIPGLVLRNIAVKTAVEGAENAKRLYKALTEAAVKARQAASIAGANADSTGERAQNLSLASNKSELIRIVHGPDKPHEPMFEDAGTVTPLVQGLSATAAKDLLLQKGVAQSVAGKMGGPIGAGISVGYQLLIVRKLEARELLGVALGVTNFYAFVAYSSLMEWKRRLDASIEKYEKFSKQELDKAKGSINATNLARMYAKQQNRECAVGIKSELSPVPPTPTITR